MTKFHFPLTPRYDFVSPEQIDCLLYQLLVTSQVAVNDLAIVQHSFQRSVLELGTEIEVRQGYTHDGSLQAFLSEVSRAERGAGVAGHGLDKDPGEPGAAFESAY